MTKVVLVTDDKLIVKDGVAETVNDNAFWADYSNIHAVQIDTEGTSWVENKDGSQHTPDQTMIDAISNKFDTTKSQRETAEQTADAEFQNSWDRVRQDRDTWVILTDKYMISDYPISSTNKTSIETYRQSLRDLPATYSSESPGDITFDSNGNVSVDGSVVITKPTIGGGS